MDGRGEMALAELETGTSRNTEPVDGEAGETTTLSCQDEPSVLRISGAVDIASASDLKAALVRALANGNAIQVTFEGTCDVDVTGLQLLWAAKREAARRDVGFAMEDDPPAAVGALLHELGMDGLNILA